MGIDYRRRYGPHAPDVTYVAHAFDEQRVDLGEIEMNYATAGDPPTAPLLCIPGQTESWWGYEAAMPRLAEHFQVYAVDLRGQGRSTRTPGRYTLDNMGNDLVRFIDTVIGRPVVVSGLSSGGVLACWLSAYAKPGQILAACYEDPPLFASQVQPPTGPGIRQSIGPMFDLWSTFLGDQWSIGAWDAMRAAAPERLPSWMAIKVPDVLLTHHFRVVDENTGALMGALSDTQAARARELLRGAGVSVTYREFPTVGHAMHSLEPDLYVDTLVEWVTSLGW